MSILFARDVLLREKWSERTFRSVSIEYTCRGPTGNTSILDASSISHIGRSFLQLDDGTMIPFHRLKIIYRDGEVIWERKIREGP